MSATLRHDIGPEVGDPFARTQAFMAAVVLAKLAGQLRSAAEDARADGVEHVAVSQAVRATAGAALPDALDAALDALAADGATARWNAVVEATYVARAPSSAKPRSSARSRCCARRCAPASTEHWRTPDDRHRGTRRGAHRGVPRRAVRRSGRAARRPTDRRRLVARDVAVRRRVDRRRHVQPPGPVPATRPGQRPAARDVRPRHPVPRAARPGVDRRSPHRRGSSTKPTRRCSARRSW